jgi:hypothetical protein
MALSDEVIRQRLQLLESYVQHLQGYRHGRAMKCAVT